MLSKFEDSPLINAEELLENIDHDNVKLFDVRGKWGDTPEEALQEYNQNKHR